MTKSNRIKLDTDKILELLIENINLNKDSREKSECENLGPLWVRHLFKSVTLCDRAINWHIANKLYNFLDRDKRLNHFNLDTLQVKVLLENNRLFSIVTDEQARNHPDYKNY